MTINGKKAKKKVKPTMKQKLAALHTYENLGKIGKSLKQAGYSDSVAKSPKIVTDSPGFKEAVKPFVEQLEDEIQAAMDMMKMKRRGALYRDLAHTITEFKKLKQLLDGKPTERHVVFGWEDTRSKMATGKDKSNDGTPASTPKNPV